MIITATYYAYMILSHIAITEPPKRPVVTTIESIKEEVSRGEVSRYERCNVTSYDLSYSSCKKKITHPDYGITATGFDLAGKSIANGDRYIAVDPEIIPYNSMVEIFFIDKAYEKYNGTYQAVDTGAAIKRYNRIDIFIGDFQQNKESQEVIDFGITEAYVRILPVDKP